MVGCARVALFSVFVVSLMLAGCAKPPPPPPIQQEIEGVAKWYSKYRNDNRGKPPKDEADLIAFINATLQERGKTVDADTLLNSPRDGQRYIIQYKEPSAKDPQKNVAVREKVGYDGKVWIAFEMGYAFEVDEAKLQELLAVE